jgi:hypothetical protein
MPDSLKLPPDEDQVEKENRDLRQQLQEYRSARPILKVEFAGANGSNMRVSLAQVAAITESEISEKIHDLERLHPPTDAFQPKPSSEGEAGPKSGARSLSDIVRDLGSLDVGLRGSVSKEELIQYGARRTSFFEAYPKYLRKRREYDQTLARKFTLEIILANSGSTPATDIDLALRFPDTVVVATEEEELEEPKPPTPPARPKGILEKMRDDATWRLGRPFTTPFTPHLDPSIYLRDFMGPHSPRNVSSIEVVEKDGYDVTCHVGRVKHGLSEPLPAIFVTIPQGKPPRGFKITYRLHAANLPEPVDGELNVIFPEVA